MGSMYQIISITTVDALFITTATAFLSMGSSFGTQQYGVFPKYPGMLCRITTFLRCFGIASIRLLKISWNCHCALLTCTYLWCLAWLCLCCGNIRHLHALLLPTQYCKITSKHYFSCQHKHFDETSAGPFKELDGSSFPPAYFKAYVTSLPLTFGIVIPVVALVYMLWERDTALAVCTLGAYLLEVVAQLVSEGSYIKQGTFDVCINVGHV